MTMKHSEKHVIHDYWSKDSLVPSPVFNRYMSRDGFLLLLRCLHFENNENEDRHDRLCKGQLAFKQYIPSKQHRFGLKLFVLCDCETGIVMDMILYSGTDVDIPAQDPCGFSGSVIKTLMKLLLNNGKVHFQTCFPIYKPDRVIDCNINMRLVDKCNIMLRAVKCVSKSVKWMKKFFFHLIDVAMLNSFNKSVKSGKRPPIQKFSVALVSQLLARYGKEGSSSGVPATMPYAVPDRLRGNENFGVHMLEYMPSTASWDKGKRACVVCKNTQRREGKRRCISTWCIECKVPLCPVSCFAAYHTLAEF
ncbi:piggyBac transposable element-derived protein 4-like [Procambarus clarkii]|uniref:piggyBac transposable element-derived protein 4-like n=1 Tax=Procambarus clarkii TaxID=6728 RepID=UPI00374388D6